MSEQGTQTEDTAPAPDERTTRSRPLRAVLMVLVAVVVLGVCGFSLFMAYRLRERLSDQQQAFQDLGGNVASIKGELTKLRSDNDALASRLNDLVRKQAQTDEQVSRLLSERTNSSTDWALAESEYLLVIATHRLILAHDVHTALAAMQAADARLRDLDLPGLTPARRQISSDMNALKSVHQVDITGLTLFLSDLAERAPKLPLNSTRFVTRRLPRTKPAPEHTDNWRELLHEMWRSLKSLVVVTRRSGGIRLLPDEKYFVIQNLQLQIQAARLAVLRRDTQALHASVKSIVHWLRTYYDVSNGGVESALQSVRQMGNVNLEPTLPDISSSLESLRAYIHQRAETSSNQGGQGP